MAMGGEGLRQQWGVNEASGPQPGQYLPAFRASFQYEMNTLESVLHGTGQYAKISDHEGLIADRDLLYQAYQGASAQVAAATDEATATNISEGVLSQCRTQRANAEGILEQARSDHDAWTGMADAYQEANDKVDELDSWGDENTGSLLQDLLCIAEAEIQRDYALAKTRLETLQGNLAAPYEEYQRQSAAKETYDPDRASFDESFATYRVAPHPSAPMLAAIEQVETRLGSADVAVVSRDYVCAQEHLDAAAPSLTELETAVTDPNRERYLDLAPDLEPLLAQVEQIILPAEIDPGGSHAARRSECLADYGSMIQAATAGDYTTAVGFADTLANKANEYLAQADPENRDSIIRQELDRIDGELQNLRGQETAQAGRHAELEARALDLQQHAVMEGSRLWEPGEAAQRLKQVENITRFVGLLRDGHSPGQIPLENSMKAAAMRELEAMAQDAMRQANEAQSELEDTRRQITETEERRQRFESSYLSSQPR